MLPHDSFFRILCVDDNSAFLQTFKVGLEAFGFDVTTASQGIDALMQYKAQRGQFGAIITDNDMPQMSGLEFIRSVRTSGFKGRVIVVSGDLSVENLRAYQKLAVTGFFHKPFEISLLATMLLQSE